MPQKLNNYLSPIDWSKVSFDYETFEKTNIQPLLQNWHQLNLTQVNMTIDLIQKVKFFKAFQAIFELKYAISCNLADFEHRQIYTPNVGNTTLFGQFIQKQLQNEYNAAFTDMPIEIQTKYQSAINQFIQKHIQNMNFQDIKQELAQEYNGEPTWDLFNMYNDAQTDWLKHFQYCIKTCPDRFQAVKRIMPFWRRYQVTWLKITTDLVKLYRNQRIQHPVNTDDKNWVTQLLENEYINRKQAIRLIT